MTSVAVVRAERDADARARAATATPRERERALERVRCSRAGQLGGRAAVGQPAQQHRELVAAEARQRVAAPQRAAQPVGDLAQQPVAVVVAERVVDLLEAVEVDQQQRRDRLAARSAAAQRAVACGR